METKFPVDFQDFQEEKIIPVDLFPGVFRHPVVAEVSKLSAFFSRAAMPSVKADYRLRVGLQKTEKKMMKQFMSNNDLFGFGILNLYE